MIWYINLVLLLLIRAGQNANYEEIAPESIDDIHNYNVKTLKNTLQLGWKQFCNADVDEGVLAFFPGSNPTDATIHLVTANNETISLPIKYLSKITELGLNPRLKTIIYVSAYLTNNNKEVREKLQHMQKVRKDYNIIVVDFAQNILQLYNTVKHNVFVDGYFISKLILTLVQHGLEHSDITLIGHSVGANIAALGAALYSQKGLMVSTLIAIDPAIMCQREDVYVNPTICDKVIVIHGENDVFSIREAIGTVDIYPNANELKYQPGCNSKMCSHTYPFHMFVDAVTGGTSVTAVMCESWAGYRRGQCDFSAMVSLGFVFENARSGKYFCHTQAQQYNNIGANVRKFKRRPSRRTYYLQ